MNTNRNFQSTLPLPRAAFLDTVGSKRGGVEVGSRTVFSDVDGTAVAVRGTQEISVMLGTACVVRRFPERADIESPEKTVETSFTSAESSGEGDVPLVEFGPSVWAFRIVKYAE